MAWGYVVGRAVARACLGLAAVALAAASCVDGEARLACPFTDCNGECVDVSKSRDHCGACDNACDLSNVCSAGSCQASCSDGLSACDGGCVDTSDDPQNCGECGLACDTGTSCVSGECGGEPACGTGKIDCDGACVDPNTSPDFCGASGDCQGANAGTDCEAGTVCDRGSCVLDCEVGLIDCDGACIDPNSDATHCGASGDCQGPNAGEACSGNDVCNGAGECELSCQGNLIACGGSCIDPATNGTYCGATGDCQGANDGTTCPPNATCGGSTCACTAPFTMNGGRCAREYLLDSAAWFGPFQDCGNGSYYNNCAAADPYGMQFSDQPGAATVVTAIALSMFTGLNCAAGNDARSISVNGTGASSFIHPLNGGCTCTPSPSEVQAEAFSAGGVAAYTVGGTNSISIPNATNCEGQSQNPAWGNAIWRVVVTY